MGTFGMLVKVHRERAQLTQSELAARAGLSTSTISRLEGGERGPPRRRTQVLALAKALELDQEETDILLSAGGFAPSTAPELSLHPRDETLYRIARELQALRTDAQIAPVQVRFVEETLLLILRGAKAALPSADLSVVASGTPPSRSLSEEERYLDDLLGDCIAGRLPRGALPLTVLAAAARSPHWELKRRLAEALPALLAHAAPGSQALRATLDPTRLVPLMATLRDDPPDAEWRTDIRRRVIEAMPALWHVRPDAVPGLLRWREGDEVYAALATLDTLADIGDRDLSAEIRAQLLPRVENEHRAALTLYAQLLDHCAGTSMEAAVHLIAERIADQARLVRVCLARSLHRILPTHPAETLKWMRAFLRRRNGQPVEHQNVRRAVARHLQGLIALLSGPHDDAALDLLRTLAADDDVHIRRAICDGLSDVIAQSAEIALDLIEGYLLQDRDRFVHERTWNALRQLMAAGSERAETLCAQLIEIA